MNALGVLRALASVVSAPALVLLMAVVAGDAVAAEGQLAGQSSSQNVGHNVGRQVYDKWCAPCHAPGPDHPGTVALDALYKGSKPGVLTERTDLTPPVIKQFVRKGVSVMPFFRKTEISDAELDALATFLSRAAYPSTLEKSRLRRFFQTLASFTAAKSVVLPPAIARSYARSVRYRT